MKEKNRRKTISVESALISASCWKFEPTPPPSSIFSIGPPPSSLWPRLFGALRVARSRDRGARTRGGLIKSTWVNRIQIHQKINDEFNFNMWLNNIFTFQKFITQIFCWIIQLHETAVQGTTCATAFVQVQIQLRFQCQKHSGIICSSRWVSRKWWTLNLNFSSWTTNVKIV